MENSESEIILADYADSADDKEPSVYEGNPFAIAGWICLLACVIIAIIVVIFIVTYNRGYTFDDDRNLVIINNALTNKAFYVFWYLFETLALAFSVAGLSLCLIGIGRSRECGNGKGVSIAGIVFASAMIISLLPFATFLF